MKTVLIILLLSSYLLSAPAFNKLRVFKNADGTTFMARGAGNQHLNWIETTDGEILKYNQDSRNYEFAKIKNNSLQASGKKYIKNSSIRTRSIRRIQKIGREELSNLMQLKRKNSLRVKRY